MEAEEIMESSFAVLVFVLGLSILMMLLQSFRGLEYAAKDNIYGGQKILYEQPGEALTAPDETVSKGELIAVLCSDLAYDLEIDGVEVLAEGHDVMQLELWELVKKDRYQKKYQYRSNGGIEKIVYQGA